MVSGQDVRCHLFYPSDEPRPGQVHSFLARDGESAFSSSHFDCDGMSDMT
jgi:hypothetical protein